MDTENGGKFFVSDYDCFVNGVRTRLGPHTSLNDINALAVSLETMNPSDVKKFEAIAESDRQADLPELVNYSYNLHCWEFSPDVRNDYDLGLATVESSDLFDTENLGAFAGYISYEKIGAVTRKENGGLFTDEGYICRNGNRIQEIYNAKDGFVSEKEMKKQKIM